MLYLFVKAVHVAACFLMIVVVLLQTGRGAGLQIFGGGGDALIQTPSGSGFMKNFTAILAGTFAFTSLFLTLLSSRAGMTSVTSRVAAPAPITAPAAPASEPGSLPGTAPQAPKAR